MARGGARQGAGRKPGAVTQKTRKVADELLGEGITPLEFMLSVLRNESKTEAERFEAAKRAAPYCHAKLAAVDMKADVNATVNDVSPDPVESESEWMAKHAG